MLRFRRREIAATAPATEFPRQWMSKDGVTGPALIAGFACYPRLDPAFLARKVTATQRIFYRDQ